MSDDEALGKVVDIIAQLDYIGALYVLGTAVLCVQEGMCNEQVVSLAAVADAPQSDASLIVPRVAGERE